MPLPSGFDIAILSTVPLGAGLSSSAAVVGYFFLSLLVDHLGGQVLPLSSFESVILLYWVFVLGVPTSVSRNCVIAGSRMCDGHGGFAWGFS